MTAPAHRWQTAVGSPEGQKPAQHIIDFVRTLRAPARPQQAATEPQRQAGYYWVRLTPKDRPASEEIVARWTGLVWLVIGVPARYEPAAVTVLSDRLDAPKPPPVASVLSPLTRAGLLRAALVGISTAWPLGWATWTRLPFGYRSVSEPPREMPRDDEAFEPPRCEP